MAELESRGAMLNLSLPLGFDGRPAFSTIKK